MKSEKHETRDADFRRITLSGLLVAGVTIAIMALLWPVYSHFGRRNPATPADFRQPAESTSPALQANPQEHLADFRASEDAELQSYGWVDRQRGIVRIPIEHAIDLISERGLPVRPQTEVAR
jgi:hypothetical protein